MRKRTMCMLLLMALLMSMSGMWAPDAQAVMKRDKTRDIAIVFDNSGSMYGASNSSWCRATYAMEVFASMMNDGDRLMIYPMWPITLGRDGADVYSDEKPLVINGPSEASKIRQIFTPGTGGTPFATVERAYAGQLRSNADEKYLIVLTDGAFEGISDDDVKAKLTEYTRTLNVMFLGIGNVNVPKVSGAYCSKAANSAEVLTKLTDMCNRIFGRKTLNVSGDQIDFDVSMGKIIVFVQGKDITDVSLDGGTKVSDHDMKYSELGRGNGSGNDTFLVDRSLQGMIATYESLDAGSYEIGYSGSADSVSVYYEPDVDLQIQLLDEGGNVLDPGTQELYAGTYRLEYGMVDKYGEPTNSVLLGDVDYDITYTVDGQEQRIQGSQWGEVDIQMGPESTMDGEFVVRYLDDYTIKKDGDALGWPGGGIQITMRPVSDFTMEVTGGKAEYDLTTLEQEAIYKVTFHYEGEQITSDALARVEFPDPQIQGGNVLCDVIQEGDGYTVSLKYNGDAASTQCGAYTVVFSASYTNEDDQTGDAPEVEKAFDLRDDSVGLGIELKLEQDYYVIKDLEGSAPIKILLTMGGAPLTAEQFAALDAPAVDLSGLEYDLQPDAGGSCYIVKLKSGDIEPGKYEVKCSVSGFDTVGRPSFAEDSNEIELQTYPLWVRILFWVLVILFILALIWAWLNMKVLPKQITGSNGKFLVGGKMVPGAIACSYTGGNKKRGSLSIKSPRYSTDPALKCGMTLELVAESPRRVPSAQRKVRVISVSPSSKSNTTKMQIGGTSMVKDQNGNFIKMGTKDNTKVDCVAGNNTMVGVAATVLSPVKGKKVSVSISGMQLKFR